jgi:uncharacterized protein (DUF433 family)
MIAEEVIMADPGDKKKDANRTTQPGRVKPAKSRAARAPERPEATERTDVQATPKGAAVVERRDGLLYVPGCSVALWRLEQARRAGSSLDALMEAFPGVSREALAAAFDYARRHRTQFDRLIREHGATPVPPEVEPDDGEGFEQELADLLDRNAELYRRLAQ